MPRRGSIGSRKSTPPRSASRTSSSSSRRGRATAIAFELFRSGGVSIAVLEVGLGGRLDAVNIIDADVAEAGNSADTPADADLHSAPVISNLAWMMAHPGIGDSHNAPVFVRCYKRMGEFISQLLGAGRQPRVMLDYSGTLLHGMRQMGLDDVFDALGYLTRDPRARQLRQHVDVLGHHVDGPSTRGHTWAAHDLNHTMQAERALMQPFIAGSGAIACVSMIKPPRAASELAGRSMAWPDLSGMCKVRSCA